MGYPEAQYVVDEIGEMMVQGDVNIKGELAEIKDKVDYEELVRLFEKWQDCDNAENDTWQSILYEYFKENKDKFSA